MYMYMYIYMIYYMIYFMIYFMIYYTIYYTIYYMIYYMIYYILYYVYIYIYIYIISHDRLLQGIICYSMSLQYISLYIIVSRAGHGAGAVGDGALPVSLGIPGTASRRWH
jgi:hypothetical protein